MVRSSMSIVSPGLDHRVTPRSGNPWPRTVLLTGATGYIGGRVLRRLEADARHPVRCLTRRPAALAGKDRRGDRGIRTVEFRASIVIGSGSASYDIVRALVETLPALVAPGWVETSAQ